MKIDLNNFKEVSYGGNKKLFFDNMYSFHNHFGHRRRTKRFPFHKNVLQFLDKNPEVRIFFTLDEDIKPFKKVDGGFLINMVFYYEFCKTIGTKTSGRCKAFLGQSLNINNANFTEEDRDEFIKTNATEENILNAIKELDPTTQGNILASLSSVVPTAEATMSSREISQQEFIDAFSRFLSNEPVQNAVLSYLPRVQIETLKSHIKFLRNNLDKNETFIQNWIDEDDGKYRKQRCLIFGLEYVDPKREGEISSKQFDLLAEQDLEHYVIFELKSPKDDIFKTESRDTIAGGRSVDYHLSPQLSRAIPEVLGYRDLYNQASNEELQKFGVQTKKPIAKCVIVLGTRKDDPVWRDNFERVSNSLNGIELLTYSHLIDRLENTVKNLEDNTDISFS